MNIDNGTSEDLREGLEVTIAIRAEIVEVGTNFITVQTEDDDEYDISDGSNWFVTL